MRLVRAPSARAERDDTVTHIETDKPRRKSQNRSIRPII